MRTQRGTVDYALQRRARLAEVTSGRTSVTDVCDASPYLVRAAKFHGQPTEMPCPVCRKENLTHVFWVYGDELKQFAGSARLPVELDSMAGRFGFPGAKPSNRKAAKSRKGKKGKPAGRGPTPPKVRGGLPGMPGLPGGMPGGPGMPALPGRPGVPTASGLGAGLDQLPPGFDLSKIKFPSS